MRVEEDIPVLLKCSLQAPDNGQWAMNGDGTLSADNVAGQEVAQESVGKVVTAAYGTSVYETIYQIELNTMERGIKLAIDKGCTRLLPQSDSTNALCYINGVDTSQRMKKMERWTRNMIGMLQGFKAIHVYREINLLADRIAAIHPAKQWRELHLQKISRTLHAMANDDDMGK